MTKQEESSTTDEVLTIDLSSLDLAEEAGEFLVTPEGEEIIYQLAQAQKKVEEALDKAKERLSQLMAEKNLIKVKGEHVTVVKRFYGERFEILDPYLAQEEGVAKVTTQIKPDTEAIDDWVKDHKGQLPESVKLRDRVEKVSISLDNDNES